MKKTKYLSMVVISLIMACCVFLMNVLKVDALSKKDLSLDIKIKSKSEASITIKGITFPKTLNAQQVINSKYDYFIYFGGYSIFVNLKSGDKLLEYIKTNNLSSIEPNKHLSYVVCKSTKGEYGYDSSKLTNGSTVSVKMSGNSVTFNVKIKTKGFDFRKITKYETEVCEVSKFVKKDFHAEKGLVTNLSRNHISKMTFGKINSYVYNGKIITPKLVIKNGKTTLKLNTDYKIAYKNNKNIGNATILITGKGKYTGTTAKEFSIIPKKTTLISATSDKKGIVTLKWNKEATASGYNIYYSNKKDGVFSLFKTTFKNTTISYKTPQLFANKTYYFKVITYKKVGAVTYSGQFSNSKAVKIPSTGKKVEVTHEISEA